MKKRFLFILAFSVLILSSFVTAVPNLSIEKIDRGSVVIAELDNPAVFDFVIDNKGKEDNFEIYSFVGVSFSPRGTFPLPEGKKTIEVLAFPNSETRQNFRGIYTFEYQLRGQESGIYKDTFSIKIVPLNEVVDIEVNPISPGDKSAEIFVKNKDNTNIENMNIDIESKFFSVDESISLKPYGSIQVNASVNEGLAGIAAGKYEYNTKIGLEGKEVEKDGELEYVEKEEIKVESTTSGLIIRTTTEMKINEGNVPINAEIVVRKNILTRLFTHFSQEPEEVDRRGVIVQYKWREVVPPGGAFSVSTTTNYTIPLLLIIFIVFVAVVARIYFLTDIILDKKVSLVKTKGGEFALRVVLNVRARKSIIRAQLIDYIPGMAKIYEGYGKRPDKIDEQHRRLEWNIGNMGAGEERAFSYIIYSKLRAVGRFELPIARVVYQKDGENKFVNSNKAYFVSESIKRED